MTKSSLKETPVIWCRCRDTEQAVEAESGEHRLVVDILCGQRGQAEAARWLGEIAATRVTVAACSPSVAGDALEGWAAANGVELAMIDVRGKTLEQTESALEHAARTGDGLSPGAERPERAVKSALVIGGGVGGVQAALDIAEGGYQTFVVESTYSIGGIMAALDKTFPTMDCSICILGPKLVDASKHKNIELITAAEVKSVEGVPGDFKVTIEMSPRYVDMTVCNGCGACVDVCPVVVPNEWDMNLKPRKAIHTMFAQSVPMRFAIDKDVCIECGMCMHVCGLNAIDLSQEPGTRELEVGAIVVAAGVTTVKGDAKEQYGYGIHENVVTNMEFERIICASGPTGGDLIRPDGKPYHRVAFIQCVGSRDTKCHEYCSMYCCIASIKEGRLVMEHSDDSEVSVFYNDMRASGKGFEELYVRSEEEGMRFVKGLPSEVRENPTNKNPIVVYEDTKTGTQKELEVDLVVLALALEPSPGLERIAGVLGLECDEYGFVKERDLQNSPLETNVRGVFIAGACSGPRDIPETVSEASGAASRVCAFFEQAGTDSDGARRVPRSRE